MEDEAGDLEELDSSITSPPPSSVQRSASDWVCRWGSARCSCRSARRLPHRQHAPSWLPSGA